MKRNDSLIDICQLKNKMIVVSWVLIKKTTYENTILFTSKL